MDSNQIFKLIDNVLPLEVCVYHQIVPLEQQENTLLLGMVYPEDPSALDYTRKMLSYLKCSPIPHKISIEEHKSILSAYLNYKGKTKQATELVKAAVSVPTSKEMPNSTFKQLQPPSAIAPAQTRRQPPDRAQPGMAMLPRQGSDTRPPGKTPAASPAANNLPQLKVRASYLSHPIEQLAKLPPQQLFQELLGRVLLKGIGRLYFERLPVGGRILWSQEGVMQSAIEELPLAVFQGVMVELKHFFNLTSIPVEVSKQVDIERMYGQTQILLVLQLNPGERGEEATLQVLRGKALQFYKQQKVAQLSQDALKLAELLQRKLSEIGSSLDPTVTPETLDTLPAINQLLDRIDEQMRSLKTQQPNVEPSETGN